MNPLLKYEEALEGVARKIEEAQTLTLVDGTLKVDGEEVGLFKSLNITRDDETGRSVVTVELGNRKELSSISVGRRASYTVLAEMEQ